MYTEMYDEIMNKSDSEPVRKMFVEMKEEVGISYFFLFLDQLNVFIDTVKLLITYLR